MYTVIKIQERRSCSGRGTVHFLFFSLIMLWKTSMTNYTLISPMMDVNILIVASYLINLGSPRFEGFFTVTTTKNS